MARVKYMRKEDAKHNKLINYPCFHASGSVKGMKDKFYGKDALLVRSGNYIYNVPYSIYAQAH